MTTDKAREIVIEGMNYAAYHETDSSLYDSDQNRLYGSEHYNSGRLVVRPSPWAEGDFEKKMADLLQLANLLKASSPKFAEAQDVLRHESSLLGRIIRRARRRAMFARFVQPLKQLFR